jgi:hypothetical protein
MERKMLETAREEKAETDRLALLVGGPELERKDMDKLSSNSKTTFGTRRPIGDIDMWRGG